MPPRKPHPTTPRREAYSVAEFAAMTGLSDDSIYRRCADKRLRCARIGGRLVIGRATVERILGGAIRDDAGTASHVA